MQLADVHYLNATPVIQGATYSNCIFYDLKPIKAAKQIVTKVVKQKHYIRPPCNPGYMCNVHTFGHLGSTSSYYTLVREHMYKGAKCYRTNKLKGSFLIFLLVKSAINLSKKLQPKRMFYFGMSLGQGSHNLCNNGKL